ncbi:MAG: UvrD-helicase domain-containing protein [Eubacteriales bacterium]|nr:UvrD-helicase domain-containing protein [Eubacteriales bacterium]
MNFTEKQRQAIDERGKTLLVSAAAGSGKTATLTRRIIESITDEKNPADVSRMLIVTFTRAAAAELRERISLAISEKIAEDPSNLRLARQALMLPDAHICTIDSFCNDILQSHASELGLSAAFRICDDVEGKLIQRTVMEELIYALYENELESVCSAEEFTRFATNITSVGQEHTLSDKLLDIYARTEDSFDGISVFFSISSILRRENDMLNTPWGEVIYDDTYKFLTHYMEAYDKILSDLQSFDEVGYKKYADVFSSWIEHMGKCLSALDEGYENTKELLNSFPAKKVPPIREKEKSTFSVLAGTIHTEFKKRLADICRYYSYTIDEIDALFEKMRDFSSVLSKVLSEYEKRINSEMKKRNIMTFSDVEKYALKLLCDINGEPTPLAVSMSEDYDYIYVDEYQDVNYIQHKIFECISQPDNRFMVGDIKQSIYSFRGAEPKIFADLKSEYPVYGTRECTGDTATVFMSENFRCDKSVIDFVNTVFDSVFGYAGDSIDYRDEDRLVFAKGNEGKETHGKVEVHLFDSKTTVTEDGNPDNVLIESEEAEFVAGEIERLIKHEVKDSGEPIQPSDIAVIVRSAKNNGERFKDAISRRGIAVNYEKKNNFFESPDVLLVLAILNSIDNPRRDTYFAGAMRSPVFGFTLSEIIAVRNEAPDAQSLYDSLLIYNEKHPDFAKGKYMTDTLSKLRAICGGIPSDKLISRLYSQTDLLSLAENSADLLLLYDYAKKFEASSFKGLYNFINYINEIIREERQISLGSVNSVNGVHLITAHHSKGLEFPVCFVCGCGSKYSDAEARENLVFDRELGAAVRFSDDDGMIVAENPIRTAIISRIRRKQAEEELRTLYVELTRARERLYVTATPKQTPEKMVDYASITSELTDEYTVLRARDPITLIVSALEENSGAANLVIHSIPGILQSDESAHIKILSSDSTAIGDGIAARPVQEKPEEGIAARPVQEKPEGGGENAAIPEPNATHEDKVGENESDGSEYDDVLCRIEENIKFEYPYSYLNRVPGKISVSRLYPQVLDGTEEGSENTEIEGCDTVDFTPKHRIPSFISGKTADEGAKRGSATHLFLQFCDFANAEKMGIHEEIRRLVNEGFIDEKNASLIREGELARFFTGELYRQIKGADKVYRELRFNMNLPASDFTEDEELKESLSGVPLLIQGVIDLIFADRDGEYTLIDYKTDRVSLKNREESREILRHRHQRQLYYYSVVCEKMFGKKPKNRRIYSLALGELIDV